MKLELTCAFDGYCRQALRRRVERPDAPVDMSEDGLSDDEDYQAQMARFIEQWNPVLEELFTELLLKQPKDPARFMLDLLEERRHA